MSRPSTPSRLTARSLVWTVSGMTALALSATTLAATPASAAVPAPGGLSVQQKNSATPVLTWGRVGGDTTYQVQVDNDPGFGSPEIDQSTRNVRFVPARNLGRGTQHWRVRASRTGKTSGWAGGSFVVTPVGVPAPTHPANGAVLPQPNDPPLLRWQSSRGATGYTVEVDGDADFIGSSSYTTRTTSLALPDAMPEGDYYWRVTATLGENLNSAPSAVSRFDLGALPVPTLVYPLDDINGAIEDVIFDWDPVPGAQYYDLQVATDSTFNNFAYKAENIRGTRFSPPTTLYNDQFWWRVRAVDLAGQATAWSAGRANFKRSWLDTPEAVWPTGNKETSDQLVAVSNGDRVFYEWTPVDHATYYVLQTSTDKFFSSDVRTCTTAGTTYAPRSVGDCSYNANVVHYWRVSAIDDPYPGGIPGIWSTPQKVMWGEPVKPAGPANLAAPVTGLKAAMTGHGTLDPATRCAATTCGSFSATPVLSWDWQPGITHYKVVVAVDENFTISPLQNAYITTNHFFSLTLGDERRALAESEAGAPYFWYVIPCDNGGCGPSPVKQNPPLPGAHSFLKASPTVQNLVTSDPAGSDITFSWRDYLATNRDTYSYGQPGQQSAKQYRIQVDTEPSFTDPMLDSAVVDQTTYTSRDRLYPEGRIYWRVQAIDAQDNGLTWSEPQSFVKASPAVVQTAPVGNAVVSGTTAFEWQPQGFAAGYDVEVYKNGDTGFSPANRVASARVKNPAYTTTDPIAASAHPYLWRVRRIDSSGNPGPWSVASFRSLGNVPSPLAPADGAWQSWNGSYVEWSDVPGAARYELTLRSTQGGNHTVGTVGTAVAPSELATGEYSWSVTAFDAAGGPLGTSVTRKFRVDAIAPKVAAVKPGKLKPTSTITVKFSERVKGVSSKTVKLKRQKASGKLVTVRASVKVKKGGLVALVDPKGRLKRATYVLTFKSSRIRDTAGNLLVESKVAGPAM